MGKTVIISGASGAIGTVLINSFLAEGYAVDGLYRKEAPARSESSFTAHLVDLSDETAVEKTVDEIFSARNTVDVIVCAAGGFAGGHIEKNNSDTVQRQYKINFLTAYHLVRPVYERMKKQGYGRIFLFGSRQGSDGTKSTGAVAYGLSKSLLFHLADILNTDSKGKVVVSVVVPSVVDTPANRRDMPDADFGNWVTTTDIAATILFYSSKAADAIRHPVIKLFKNS